MFLSRRVLAITSVFSLVVLGMFVITHESAPPPSPALPLGKVQPYLWTDMLLAPDGSLWALEHSGTGRPGSVTLNPISPGNDWKTVSGVAGYGVGVKEDGTLWLWQPGGAPSSSTRPTPVQIGLERDWAYASHSWNYAPLLKQDGSLWYLGDEYIDSKTPPSPLKPAMRPSRIGSDNDWVRIANCNGVHYALKKDGTLWHWGRAGHRGPYATTPQLLSPDKDWASMSRGSFILALIKQDGSLWITGQGAGTVASDHVAGSVLDPVRIGNDNHWQEAVGGESSLLVRHTDGSWWALGENQMGLLGFPRATKLGTPQRLRFQLDLWAWSANGETTLFLTRDGGIYYLGRTPGPRALTGLAGVKNVINREVSRVGIPPPFSGLGDSWTDRPVRIGELPASVVTGLRNGS